MINKILDAYHKRANLKIICNISKYLSNDKQSLIYIFPRKHEEIFDGSLGNYIGSEYKIEHLEGAKPYHAKSISIPKIYKESLKTEVNRLININVLKCKNKSKWETSIFKIPKKNETVCFISEFRELNKRI